MPKYRCQCDDGGFTGLVMLVLGSLFVTLKLCGVVGWSWWLVTLPFWILPALAVAIVVLITAMVFVAFCCFFVTAVFAGCVDILTKRK